MSTHAPEPWMLHGARGSRYMVGAAAKPCSAPPVISHNAAAEGSPAHANMQRIVACVNACQGMVDPVAYVTRLRNLVDSALPEALPVVRAQRDELLGAMRRIALYDNAAGREARKVLAKVPA